MNSLGLAWWEIALGAFAAGLVCGFHFYRKFGLCRHDLEHAKRGEGE